MTNTHVATTTPTTQFRVLIIIYGALIADETFDTLAQAAHFKSYVCYRATAMAIYALDDAKMRKEAKRYARRPECETRHWLRHFRAFLQTPAGRSGRVN